MNELDLLVENYFTDSFEASDLFRLVEQMIEEESIQSQNVEKLKNILRLRGYDDSNFAEKKTSAYVTQFKLLVPLTVEQRISLAAELRNKLEKIGYEYDYTYGRTGRFANISNPRDKVHFMIKPSGEARTRPQDAGEEYEKNLESSIANILGDNFIVTTAGFGHGSDITITSADGAKSLSIEAKTSVGADFGQGSARYNNGTGDWEINPTAQMMHNENKYALFLAILDSIRVETGLPSFSSLDSKDFGPGSEEYGDIYINKDNNIYGLRRSPKTKELSQLIQQEWFAGQESLYIAYDAGTITKYYASKGDDLMQIKGHGLYALNERVATILNIPLFHEGVSGQIRFRLKTHGGAYDRRSFTIANQIRGSLAPSPLSLDREEDLFVIAKLLE